MHSLAIGFGPYMHAGHVRVSSRVKGRLPWAERFTWHPHAAVLAVAPHQHLA